MGGNGSILKAAKFRFVDSELPELKAKFNKYAQSGKIDKGGLVQCFGLPLELSYGPLGDRFFQLVAPTSRATRLEFKDYMKALGVLARGTPAEKQQFAFDLLDIDNDGKITQAELVTVLTALANTCLMQKENADLLAELPCKTPAGKADLSSVWLRDAISDYANDIIREFGINGVLAREGFIRWTLSNGPVLGFDIGWVTVEAEWPANSKAAIERDKAAKAAQAAAAKPGPRAGPNAQKPAQPQSPAPTPTPLASPAALPSPDASIGAQAGPSSAVPSAQPTPVSSTAAAPTPTPTPGQPAK